MPIEKIESDDDNPGLFIDHTRSGDLDYVADINYAVANHLFPSRNSSSMFLKMYGEISELVNDPTNCEEAIDAIIMLMDHVTRMGGSVGPAILKKLETNLRREWYRDLRTNVYHHVKLPFKD